MEQCLRSQYVSVTGEKCEQERRLGEHLDCHPLHLLEYKPSV